MNQPGRNDPCPCGSGRKYKHCCGSSSASSAASTARRVREVAAATSTWLADAVPINVHMEDDKHCRPVAVLVVANELVVHTNVLGRLRGEPGDVAVALERGVAAAARDVGVFPERVLVRHDDVAAALAPLLSARQTAIEVGENEQLVEAARSLSTAMQGSDPWPPICRPLTWQAWGQPPALVAELFSAAATFYERAPWRDIANLQAPRVLLPSGRAWTCCILGNAGEEFGLALYTDADDLFRNAAERVEVPDMLANLRGRIVTLTFDTVTNSGREATAELRRHRWPIAGPAAYPSIIAINTPGGGVSHANLTDMIALLRTMPDFVATHARALRREEATGEPLDPLEWTEPASGIVFRYAGEAMHSMQTAEVDDAAEADPLRAEVRAAIRDAVEALGEDADRDALLEHVNRSLQHIMERANDAPQPDMGGLSPNQLRGLLYGDWLGAGGGIELRTDLTLRDVGDTDIFANARALLELARERGGALGATQAGYLKLDVVAELLDLLRPDIYTDLVRRHNKRITEADIGSLHRLRVVCGLAGLLRKRSQRFELTAAGKRLLEDARAGELYRRLFHTWFRKFNLAFGARWHWPELQQQVGYTLYRLLTVAGDWQPAEALLEDVVLPYALQQAPASPFPEINMAALDLGIGVLDPLVDFGLLERRPERTTALQRRTEKYRTTSLARAFIQINL